MKTLLLLLPALAAMSFADGPGRIVSRYAAADFPLTPDPEAPAWKGIPGVFAENDAMGKPVAGHSPRSVPGGPRGISISSSSVRMKS
jgi:hypothetical protein